MQPAALSCFPPSLPSPSSRHLGKPAASGSGDARTAKAALVMMTNSQLSLTFLYPPPESGEMTQVSYLHQRNPEIPGNLTKLTQSRCLPSLLHILFSKTPPSLFNLLHAHLHLCRGTRSQWSPSLSPRLSHASSNYKSSFFPLLRPHV